MESVIAVIRIYRRRRKARFRDKLPLIRIKARAGVESADLNDKAFWLRVPRPRQTRKVRFQPAAETKDKDRGHKASLDSRLEPRPLNKVRDKGDMKAAAKKTEWKPLRFRALNKSR
jgi:hypothetical protein